MMGTPCEVPEPRKVNENDMLYLDRINRIYKISDGKNGETVLSA
jgi:hypothetical protein